jgi:hypothetical protein
MISVVLDDGHPQKRTSPGIDLPPQTRFYPIQDPVARRSRGGLFGTWGAVRAQQEDITEDEAREALTQLDPLWDELFPAEQARIVQLLVERVDVRMNGVEVRLRPSGLAGLVREVAGSRRAA